MILFFRNLFIRIKVTELRRKKAKECCKETKLGCREKPSERKVSAGIIESWDFL